MIVCALEEGQQSSAATAFAAWLSESLALPLRLDSADPPDELTALSARPETRLIVVGVGDGPAQLETILSKVDASPTPVVVLPEGATGVWENPHRARRTVRPNVVCGTDGSPIAAGATAIAAELAARLDGRLVVVHAVGEPLPRESSTAATSIDGVWGPIRATARSELVSRALAELRKAPSEVCFRELHGDPVEVIDRVGAAESAAMIAVGSRGLGRARLALSGSIAASLLKRATHPVLVIPPRVTHVAAATSAERESTLVP